MPEKKKSKTAGETYDERARSLMKAIDTRRADRTIDAPKRRLIDRIREEEGRPAVIADVSPMVPGVDDIASMFSNRRPSPGAEYQRQRERALEVALPELEGNPMRAKRNWSYMMYDNNEGLSGLSGTPGELLPPYRVSDARRVADAYDFSQRRHAEYADELARENIENLARDARKKTPPVTKEDIDSMREMFARPGETSNVRDYIDMLPPAAQFDERVRRADAAWKRNNAPKKKGK
jgi:hypothetical protein